jgi:GNAT superfamily N-acetyltransferase
MGTVVPVRRHEESWPKRRALYQLWLAEGDSFLLGAFRDNELVGYAMVHVADADPVWVTGERYTELMSLSVAPHERGHGVGTALLDDVEARLLAQGIDELVIGVDTPNTTARRFYEARGFKVGYHLMHGRLGAPGRPAAGRDVAERDVAEGDAAERDAAAPSPSERSDRQAGSPETAAHGDD